LHTLVLEDPFEEEEDKIEEMNLEPSRSPSLEIDQDRLEYGDDIIGAENEEDLI